MEPATHKWTPAASAAYRFVGEERALKYLYADSEPFPLRFNFLSTLKGLLTCSGQVGNLQREIEELEAGIVTYVHQRNKLVEELGLFGDGVCEDIRHRGEIAAPPAILGFAEQIIDAARGIVDRGTKHAEREIQTERGRVAQEIETRKATMKAALAPFLSDEVFQVLDSSFGMSLLDNEVHLRRVDALPRNIQVCYRLDPGSSPNWGGIRKLSDFTPGMNIQIGLKKKRFSKTLQPEVVLLDEYVITKVEYGGNRCEVSLRKRLESPGEGLTIQMAAGDGGFAASIRQMAAGEWGEPFAVEADDLDRLKALWGTVRDSALEQPVPRKTLEWVHVEGNDVIEHNLVVDLLERLTDEFRPYVHEISTRSPSRDELSLKLEHGDGRREEIYVKKGELSGGLRGLPDALLEKLAFAEILPNVEEGVTNIVPP